MTERISKEEFFRLGFQIQKDAQRQIWDLQRKRSTSAKNAHTTKKQRNQKEPSTPTLSSSSSSLRFRDKTPLNKDNFFAEDEKARNHLVKEINFMTKKKHPEKSGKKGKSNESNNHCLSSQSTSTGTEQNLHKRITDAQVKPFKSSISVGKVTTSSSKNFDNDRIIKSKKKAMATKMPQTNKIYVDAIDAPSKKPFKATNKGKDTHYYNNTKGTMCTTKGTTLKREQTLIKDRQKLATQQKNVSQSSPVSNTKKPNVKKKETTEQQEECNTVTLYNLKQQAKELVESYLKDSCDKDRDGMEEEPLKIVFLVRPEDSNDVNIQNH